MRFLAVVFVLFSLSACKCRPETVTPAELGFHVQPLSLDRFGEPLHAFPAFTASVCHLRPASRGHVRVHSPDPLSLPKISPRYLSEASDRAVAAAALRLTRRIVASPALQRYRPTEFLPGESFQTDEDLARAAGDIGTTIFHPVGTAAMGRVVDAELRVIGLDRLRVIDAAVMPTITSGNTNAPTMMIAEKGAEMVLQAAR